MNENTKTASFVVVAAVVAGLCFGMAWIQAPGGDQSLDEQVGKSLFPDFQDPLSAVSLEIVRYNEGTGDRTRFEVAQVNDIWSIPSHDNYPADAERQLADAAADLIDLKILGVAGDRSSDHALYGVIDPTDKELGPGTEGVGMKVVMKGEKDKSLVSMIVGKEDPDSPGLRYVRKPGQDAVFTVKLSTDRLSTDFGDWIEKDLLKLNRWDIREVFIQDYTIDEARQVQIQRGQITVAHDESGDPKWKLVADREMDEEGQWVDIPLGPTEELNPAKLDTMASALDDLQIVDVVRKPAGLSANLAADESFAEDTEARVSLARRGFHAVEMEPGKVEILSNRGEIRVLMNDGVEYVLRFGGIAGDASTETEGGESTKGVNRYLFVTTEFNPRAIPQPELEPLPTAEPVKEQPEAEEKAETPEEPKKPETKEPAEPKTDSSAEDEPKENPEDEKAAEDQGESSADADLKAKDAAKAKLEQQREQAEKENKRKQEEYEQKLADGKKRVAELNARFADWYYIISESVYQEIHLGRSDLIKPKEAKEGEEKTDTPVDQLDPLAPEMFERLKEGLKGKEDKEEATDEEEMEDFVE
ncbi:MAG: DUF4340 domain-containing protein [Pirellulaceae bacterium]|nr:DUF4340 domain-containing protein [Pirellulaceae bacterium]